ncbi:MAG: hypothetical protein LC101_05745 [Flavobacteriales bacterium]|nr:hypothetical protein [Flavobacteriales bacterium]MCZ2443257.1 hypothetical protein [Flavobacteriales bacterium]
MMRLIGVSFITALLFLSCTNKAQKKMAENFALIFNDEKGLLRHTNLGDPYFKVAKDEEAHISFQDETMIRSNYLMGDNEKYAFSYLFIDEKLNDIFVDAFLPTVSDGAFLTEWMSKKLNAKFDFQGEEKGTLRWDKDGISIELTDESELYGYGMVKILYFITPDSEKKFSS